MTPEQASSAQNDPERLALHLDGFDGPLDLLLSLARAQKVDLAGISILALVEQYLAVIESARHIRLELAADWLVMAAWLAWLKSRLLLPPAEQPEECEPPGDVLALRLRALDGIRRAAGWLGDRPLLGIEVFPRGMPEDFRTVDRSRLLADSAGLVRAYLEARRRAAARQSYTPAPMTLWSVQDALTRLGSLLGTMPPWTTLERYLPSLADPTPTARRAAYAATLVAGLELARTGQVSLRQEQPFGPIAVGRPGR